MVPFIVTTVPTGPLVGVKLVMVGCTPTKKSVVDNTVPDGVVTLIGPVVEPAPTVAVICVALFTVYDAAGVELNATVLAFVKSVPVMVTTVPTGPPKGVNPVMVGGGVVFTVKLVAEVAVPPGVVTLTAPVVVPVATVAVIWVALFTVNEEAATLLNDTAEVAVKWLPVIVTEVPTSPLVGVKLVMVGAGVIGAEDVLLI